VRTLAKVFPNLPAPRRDAGGSTRHCAIRRPVSVQSDMYATYHMSSRRFFYHGRTSGRSRCCRAPASAGPVRAPHDHAAPEERQAEFILMVPFTPRARTTGFVVWRGTTASTTQLIVVSLPQAEPGLRAGADREPHQPGHRDRRQISLWDQRGSQVIRGNLLSSRSRNR